MLFRSRSSDVDAGIREEYVTFLKHLMSVCRRYEYGLLGSLQEQVIADALDRAGLSADADHGNVEIGFSCSLENVKEEGMKRLLCQIGKEAEEFRIMGLR